MATILSVAADLILIIIQIKKISANVDVNKRQSVRLASRIACVVPTLHRIRDNTAPHSYTEAMLMEMLYYLNDVKNFLAKFDGDYLRKAWKNFYSDAKVFNSFNQGVSDRLGAHRLQFDLFSDELKNIDEDVSDRDFDRQEIRARLFAIQLENLPLIEGSACRPTPEVIVEPQVQCDFDIDDAAEMVSLLKQLRNPKCLFNNNIAGALRRVNLTSLRLNQSIEYRIGQ